MRIQVAPATSFGSLRTSNEDGTPCCSLGHMRAANIEWPISSPFIGAFISQAQVITGLRFTLVSTANDAMTPTDRRRCFIHACHACNITTIDGPTTTLLSD